MSRITRRGLTSGAALGLASAVAAPALAQSDKRRWRMVTSWPKRLPGPGMSAERVAERIGALSGGRIEITVSAAGEIVPALEVLDAVGTGVAEMGHTAAFYWQGKEPAAAFFTTVPFGQQPERACRLDRGRRRSGAVGRDLCAVRRQAVHGRQYRRLHGRLVSPRDQKPR
jgi:TRAP-type mannitol/chloroaromatic compound transport system substrate-binding protein